MSAAAVISPMLITFLNIPAYEAVGIALASDVLASAVSAYTYGKNKNLDIRNGLVMMAAVLCLSLIHIFSVLLHSQIPRSCNNLYLQLGSYNRKLYHHPQLPYIFLTAL